MAFADAREIIKQVCSRAVDAGFMELRLALSALEDKPADCNSTPLRIAPLSDARLQLGVGSTFEAAGAADRLRDKIGDMYRDGTLAATMAKYSYYGLESEWATYDMMEAAERARWLAWGLSALGVALGVTLWLSASLRQRKRSETALRASEERFRAIFHQAAVGHTLVTLEGVATTVNDRYCEVLGYLREELVGRRLVDTTHSDDCAEVQANRRLLLEGEIASYSMEIRCVRKDGRIIWVKLHESLVRDGSGQPTCSLALVDDITERRQTEAALQESEKRFRNMADTAPAMIWVAGPDKLCTFFNQGWLTFTGCSLEDALGNGWSSKVHPDDREPCRIAYSAAFDARRTYQKECRLERADGEYRWVLTTGAPRFEANGSFAGFVGSCTDITEVKRTQEEALARQKLEGLGVLAGGIAHDFNNLLGGILATSELVLSELPVDSPAYGGVESIKKVADRAAEIVRQMMAYAGQESMVFEPLDLAGLVNEMLQLLKISISKRAFLTVDLPGNLPAIRANPAQVRRIVMNLILNASEALGEDEGTISVALEHVRCAADRFSSEGLPTRNDHVRLIVGDTGSGMTEEIRARIFDPFFTTKFTGRGMGLAAVQGIVRDHGGTINVVSIPGHGSRFEVMLPCTVQPTRASRTIALPASSAAGGRVNGTVLVVEDEEELRTAVSKMLRKRDFRVVEAPDGRAGVDLFRANQRQFDVVLLDLTLPGMTGREVLEELRRLRPDLKVIITTAYSQDTAVKALGGQQSWFYIRKPYRAVEIEDLLRSVCVHERPRGHAAS